ncbi:MAG TPA: hypothetical protein PLA10_06995, partial [Clostridiales bacterium]|nr:hypothetical protein [Clostridiales bacterium]
MRKFVSIVLAIVLMFSVCMPAFAAGSVGAENEPTPPEYPLIVIRGVNFMNEYLDVGTKNERIYIPPIKASDIFAAVFKGAAAYAVTSDKKKFLTPVLDYLNETFKYI